MILYLRLSSVKDCLHVQNVRRELAEKRFTAELNVEAACKFLDEVGCDVTQTNMESEDGKVTYSVVSSFI